MKWNSSSISNGKTPQINRRLIMKVAGRRSSQLLVEGPAKNKPRLAACFCCSAVVFLCISLIYSSSPPSSTSFKERTGGRRLSDDTSITSRCEDGVRTAGPEGKRRELEHKLDFEGVKLRAAESDQGQVFILLIWFFIFLMFLETFKFVLELQGHAEKTTE